MLLLFGSPRSGTTLLAVALSQHPDIHVTFEANVIVPVCHLVMNTQDGEAGREAIARFIVTSKEFDRVFRPYLAEEEVRDIVFNAEFTAASILGSLYARLGEKLDKPIVGDKTPNDISHLHILMDSGFLFAGHKVIHLVRDVRDTILSTYRTPWCPPAGFEAGLALIWQQTNMDLHNKFMSRKDSGEYILVRYEDLVREPAKQLARITDFLEVPFDEAVLRPESMQGHSQLGALGEHANLKRGFVKDRVRAWKTEMDPEVRARVEAQSHELLRWFWYETDYAAPYWQFRRWKAALRVLKDAAFTSLDRRLVLIGTGAPGKPVRPHLVEGAVE